MKHIVLRPHLRALDHRLHDLFNKIMFCLKKKYSCPFLIAPSVSSYHDFLDRGLVLTGKLLSPWFPVAKWKSSFRKHYDRQHILVNYYGSCVSQMTTYIFRLSFRVFSCLSGARVINVLHVIILYDVICCNVRYHVRAKTTFESSRLSILLFVG